MIPCLIADCQLSVHSRGLCNPHYTKLKKSGEIDGIGQPPKTGPKSGHHILTNKDEKSQTAVCAVCGPSTPIFYKKSKRYWACRVKNLEGQKSFRTTGNPIVFNKAIQNDTGLCSICKKSPATHLDHCHTTGEVRGMLCRNCNLGIGYFSDDITILLSAISYLSIEKPLPA